jgi:hypothetical protein
MKRDDPRVPASTHGLKQVDVRKQQSSPYFSRSVASSPPKKLPMHSLIARSRRRRPPNMPSSNRGRA